MLYLIIFFIAILIMFLFLKLHKKIMVTTFHITNLTLLFFIVLFIILIISFPNISFTAASNGLKLWFNVVFPSLLPFLICSELLIGLGFVNFLGTLLEPIMKLLFNVPGCGSFALAMGLTSGYPTGAKITTILREKELCTKTEGERLLTFTNNSGPLFIIGAVAVGMFNSPYIGFILALSHYLASITVGILFRFYKKDNKEKKLENNSLVLRNLPKKALKEMFAARRKDGRNIGILLGDSVKNAVNLLLVIGGFIVFFSVVISILTELHILSKISIFLCMVLVPIGIDNSLVNAILSGIIEITTGAKLASICSAMYIQKVVAAAFILGWAGFSVHLQVISIISKTDLSPIPYLCGKFIQGIIAAIYTYFLFSYVFISKSAVVFSNYSLPLINYKNSFITSLEFLFGVLFLLLILSLIIIIKNNIMNGKDKTT